MSSRWTGLFVWFLVAVCTAFWGLKIFAAIRPVPPSTRMAVTSQPAGGPLVRLFGAVEVPAQADTAPPAASDRFQLVGVIAPRAGANAGNGIAIVSIDSQPAKAWHVGATVEGDTTLLSVAKREAQFGPRGGPTAFTLELPEPAAPETGTLPTAVSQPDGPAPIPRAATPNRVLPIARPGVPNFAGARPGMPVNPIMRGMPGTYPPNPGQLQPGMRPGRVPVQQQQQDDPQHSDDE